MSQLSSLSPRRPGDPELLGYCPRPLPDQPGWPPPTPPLTLTVQNVVPGEHDATAHNVPFVTARPKGVPHATAMEDLPVICWREGRGHALEGGLTPYTPWSSLCLKLNLPSLLCPQGREEARRPREKWDEGTQF